VGDESTVGRHYSYEGSKASVDLGYGYPERIGPKRVILSEAKGSLSAQGS